MRGTTQIRADSAAYLPYALALTGHYEEAVTQLTGIMGRLYDEKTKLYLHMWDEGSRSYVRPLVWGIGNGWILTEILLHHLEKSYLERAEQIRDHIMTLETEDGLFLNACSSPDFTNPGTAAECQAHVLMMEAMRERALKEEIHHVS